MRKDYQWQLKERYEKLKQDLYNPKCYPYVNSILNLPSFIKQNESLYGKLLQELKQLRKHHQSIHKREVKLKTSPFYLQQLISSTTNQEEQSIADLRSKNEILKASIIKLKQERTRKAALEQPVIKQKQKQLENKREETKNLIELNKQLKNAMENEELLELYELKCRECESLRIVNNELSEELKGVITDLNKATGSEENPNMFLLTLGIR